MCYQVLLETVALRPTNKLVDVIGFCDTVPATLVSIVDVISYHSKVRASTNTLV